MALKKTAIIELLVKDKGSLASTKNLKEEFQQLNATTEMFEKNAGSTFSVVGKKGQKAAKSMGSAFKRSQGNIQGSGAAVTNLSRIIQDAPFGTMGVANNIEPFITSFQNLSKQTGSTTSAMKTLLTSAFTGPGALITIVSLVTSALTAISMGIIDLGDDAEETEEALGSVLDKIDRIIEVQGQFGAFDDDEFGIAEAQARIREITEEIDKQQAKLRRVNELENRRDALLKKLSIYGDLEDSEQQQLDNLNQQISNFGEQEKIEEDIKELEDERLNVSKQMVRTAEALTDEDTKQAQKAQETNKEKEKRLELEKKLREITEQARQSVANEAPEDTIFEGGLSEEQLENEINTDALEGSIQAAQDKISELRKQWRMAATDEGRQQIASEIETIEEKINSMTGATEEGLDQNSKAFGQAIGQAITYSDTVEEAAANVIKALINEIVTRAILAAFQPPTPASLALAPIFAATAQKLISSLVGFRSGVDDFEGGPARVHKGEMITNLPQGANVITNRNVQKLDRMQRQAGQGAGNLMGASSKAMASAVREAVVEGMQGVHLNPEVSIKNIDDKLNKLRKWKQRIGN